MPKASHPWMVPQPRHPLLLGPGWTSNKQGRDKGFEITVYNFYDWRSEMIHTNDVFHAFQEYRNKAIVIPTGTAGRL